MDPGEAVANFVAITGADEVRAGCWIVWCGVLAALGGHLAHAPVLPAACLAQLSACVLLSVCHAWLLHGPPALSCSLPLLRVLSWWSQLPACPIHDKLVATGWIAAPPCTLGCMGAAPPCPAAISSAGCICMWHWLVVPLT